MTASARSLPRATVRAVALRAGGYCERCHRWLRSSYSYHHRCPRGMGGTRDPLSWSPANIVLICGSGVTGCHGWLESHIRGEAIDDGWILPQMTNGERTDPREQPIWIDRLDSWMIPGPGRWFALPERIAGHELNPRPDWWGDRDYPLP